MKSKTIMKNIIFNEDCLYTLTERKLNYDYVIFSPPDYDELGMKPIKDDEKYFSWLGNIFSKLKPNNNTITIVVSNRRYNRITIPKHHNITSIKKDLGYGKNYKYPHSYPDGFVKVNYFPEELNEKPKFYEPKKLGREKFLKHSWEWTEKYGGIIIKQLKRLGCSCDWSRQRFTMDDQYYSSVIKTFVKLYNEGLIYKGVRMVNWDPKGLTALSDEEVIYKEDKGKLWYIK